MTKWIVAIPILVILGFGAWGGAQAWSRVTQPEPVVIPVTKVRRGDVSITVTARGDLQGGKSQLVQAPMVGGSELFLTQLRKPGELVQKDDVVAQFDTTEQVYRLREAEADLAEAEQKVLEARFASQASEEEDRFNLLKARGDLKLAELEARKNFMLAAIPARQNELAVEAARTHLQQLEKDLSQRRASADASIAIQQAAVNKAKVMAAMAQRNIDSMTLKAASPGYVSIQQNQSSTGIMYTGMTLPTIQLGDSIRPGMGVALIPDLSSWELVVNISELDRGLLKPDQLADVAMVAFPGKKFHAKVKTLGNTSGPQWDRRFECKLELLDPTADLRPGLNADIVITTEVMKAVLSLPAHALFESDGRRFVYLKKGEGFVQHNVTLERRSESRVVISGLQEGQFVALANPTTREAQKKKDSSGAQAIQKGKG